MSTNSIDGKRNELIQALKFSAKHALKAVGEGKHSAHLDHFASTFGYNNWSQLHQHLQVCSEAHLDDLLSKAPSHGVFAPFDEESAIEEMSDWVERHYTRLVEFAYHDSESPNGYAWPEEDISDGLQDEFSDRFPFDLIWKVAIRLEQDGPWGIEEYGADDE